MIKSAFYLTCAALLSIASPVAFSQKKPNPAMAKIEDDPALPRVLLIGDSISIGYTVGVRDLLKGKANVHRPLTNCGPTTTGLAKLDEWLKTGGADKKWDVIHFNWGLHDLKYMGPKGQNLADTNDPASKRQVPPEEYEKNLTELVKRLKATGAKLIWRNTTPVVKGTKGRLPADAKVYNDIAAGIMVKNDIEIQDMYAALVPQLKTVQLPTNVHFNAAGNKVLSELVADKILEDLDAEK